LGEVIIFYGNLISNFVKKSSNYDLARFRGRARQTNKRSLYINPHYILLSETKIAFQPHTPKVFLGNHDDRSY